MQFSNKEPEHSKLLHFILDYYAKQNRKVQYLGEGTEYNGGSEGDNYYVDFLLDKKHQIRCSLRLAIRTFSTILISKGTYFISLMDLVPSEQWQDYIFDSNSEGMEYILKKLDKYLLEQENTCCKELKKEIEQLKEEINNLKSESFFSKIKKLFINKYNKKLVDTSKIIIPNKSYNGAIQ